MITNADTGVKHAKIIVLRDDPTFFLSQ